MAALIMTAMDLKRADMCFLEETARPFSAFALQLRKGLSAAYQPAVMSANSWMGVNRASSAVIRSTKISSRNVTNSDAAKADPSAEQRANAGVGIDLHHAGVGRLWR